MIIEIPTTEIILIVAIFFLAKWFFRFLIIALTVKLLSGLKEKGADSLKGFQEKMNQGEK